MGARELFFAANVALATFGALAAACTGTGGAPGATADGGLPDGDAGPKPSCVSCHMPEYLDVRKPPHDGVKPTTCGVCHSQQGWTPSVLDHPWPLTGKHEKADCFKCHSTKPPKFKGTDKACYACHAAEYDKPPFPDHMLLQKTCEDCHTTTDWKKLVPKPIWPPDDPPKEADGGSHDGGESHDAAAPEETHDAGAAKPKPKPKPKPQPHPPPDVTVGPSRHIHR